MSEKLTLDEYLGKYGYASPVDDYMIDKTKLPHGETQRQKEKRIKENELSSEHYHSERQRLIDEYWKKIKTGEIIEPSKEEQWIKKAYGHTDNRSVQATIRMLKKRGFYQNDKGEWVKGERYDMKDLNDYERLTKIAEHIKKEYPKGTRIVLLNMGYDLHPIPSGTRGTVMSVDDIGTVHCNFDNGRALGLAYGEDTYRKLYENELNEENEIRQPVTNEKKFADMIARLFDIADIYFDCYLDVFNEEILSDERIERLDDEEEKNIAIDLRKTDDFLKEAKQMIEKFTTAVNQKETARKSNTPIEDKDSEIEIGI